MRIIFIDHYNPTMSVHKDPITIPHELATRRHDVLLVSVDEWRGELFGLKVEPLSDWLTNTSYARQPDAVVAITRFNPKLTPILRKLKARGIHLVVKGDTDGTIGYPVPPNYLRVRPLRENPINVFRHLKWRLPLSSVVRPRLEHVILSDLTVVESPGAAVNLVHVLQHWGCAAKIDNLRFIPNPVSPDAMRIPLAEEKIKTIVSVGRWDDPAKGSNLLRQTITHTLNARRDYSFRIIGNNGHAIRSSLHKKFQNYVECADQLGFEQTQEQISTARILLVTSVLESFSFVTAEALCAGTSVVVTPIESLVYLAGGGAYGSISRAFTSAALNAALLREIHQWEHGARDAEAISMRWRRELDPARIGQMWEQVLETI